MYKSLMILAVLSAVGCEVDGEYMYQLPCDYDWECPVDMYCDYHGLCAAYPEEEVVYVRDEYDEEQQVEYVDCLVDSDCEMDEVCYENVCVVEVECLYHTDCGPYEICDEGWCASEAECFRDSDCLGSQQCESDGICHDSQCASSWDCPGDTICETGRCVVPYTTYTCWVVNDCPPGQNTCVDVQCPPGESTCPGMCVE